MESGPGIEEKGRCLSRKHLQGREVIGSPYGASSVPRAQGREDGGGADTRHITHIVLDWTPESMSEGSVDTWS